MKSITSLADQYVRQQETCQITKDLMAQFRANSRTYKVLEKLLRANMNELKELEDALLREAKK